MKNKIDNSSSSFSQEEFEEPQEAFEALYKESIKMAKGNWELKDLLNKVALEKETLEQKMTLMETKLASLQR